MRAFVFVSVVVLYCCTVCICGPTEPGAFTITPSPVQSARKQHSIPVSITARKPDGSVDTSIQQPVALSGRIRTAQPTLQFSDSFESATINTFWKNTGIGTRLSTVTSYKATTQGARSAYLTGGAAGVTDSHSSGYYVALGGGEGTRPVRLSYYLRASNASASGPYVQFKRYYCGFWSCSYLAAVNCMFYGDTSVPRIRFRFGEGTATGTPEFPSGFSNGFYPVVANRWYKVDLVLDWTNHKVNLWVDDTLAEANVPMISPADVDYVDRLYIYNFDNTNTWIDEMKLYLTEPVNSGSVSLSITSVNLIGGTWSGDVKILSGTDNQQNVFLQAAVTSSTRNLLGETNTFTILSTCPGGQYASEYFSSCQSCAAGSFSQSSGSNSCTQCSPGHYQNVSGQTSCRACDTDFYNNKTGSSSSSDCLPCPSGTFSSPGSAYCGSCDPGYWKPPSLPCTPCPVGQFGLGYGGCVQCSPGTFNNRTGQSECVPCSNGTAQPDFGQSECVPCDPGYKSTGNAATCTPCSPGYYNEVPGNSECQACPMGTFNPNNASTSHTACQSCGLGNFSDEVGSPACVACDAGSFANVTGLVDCFPCPMGTAVNTTGAHACQDCQPGFMSGNTGETVCVPCDPGFRSVGVAASECVACQPGETSRAGSSVCIKCPLGFFSNISGAPECTECPFGYSTVVEGSTMCTHKCGNGQLDTGEFCDDGNLFPGDGCNSTCVIEQGWACPRAGEPCVRNSASTGDNVNSDNDGGSNNVSIIAGVVGSILGCLLLVAIIAVLLLVRKRKQNPATPADVDIPLGEAPNLQYRTIPSSLSVRLSAIHHEAVTLDGRNVKHQIAYTELKVPGSGDSNGWDKAIVGKGAFGVVYKAEYRGQLVAVKEIKSENISEQDLEAFVVEANLMGSLQPHNNVVLFIGLVTNPFCIVAEFLEGGDLRSLLVSHEPIDMDLKLRIIRDIATGMMHLASEGIVHRDLAARNILLTKNRDVAKVSDFGLSRLADGANVVYSKSDIGPLKWMSPEAIRRKKYSEKSDVWSFAVTCWEILARDEPYNDMDAVQVATAVVSERMVLQLPSDAPPALATLVAQCFEYEPEDRPTFKQICLYFVENGLVSS